MKNASIILSRGGNFLRKFLSAPFRAGIGCARLSIPTHKNAPTRPPEAAMPGMLGGVIFLSLILCIALAGCGETISGVGKDINRMGRGVNTFFFRQ